MNQRAWLLQVLELPSEDDRGVFGVIYVLEGSQEKSFGFATTRGATVENFEDVIEEQERRLLLG